MCCDTVIRWKIWRTALMVFPWVLWDHGSNYMGVMNDSPNNCVLFPDGESELGR